MKGSASQAQAWAMRAGMHAGGAGAGGSSATSTVTRSRDLAAYHAMAATLPMKPPKRLKLEEPGK